MGVGVGVVIVAKRKQYSATKSNPDERVLNISRSHFWFGIRTEPSNCISSLSSVGATDTDGTLLPLVFPRSFPDLDLDFDDVGGTLVWLEPDDTDFVTSYFVYMALPLEELGLRGWRCRCIGLSLLRFLLGLGSGPPMSSISNSPCVDASCIYKTIYKPQAPESMAPFRRLLKPQNRPPPTITTTKQQQPQQQQQQQQQ